MKSYRHARLALKALHQAGVNKKNVRKILPDISSAIDKISASKNDKRSEWKNALWRFVSKFSQLDAIELVRIFELTLEKTDKAKAGSSKSDKSNDKNIPVKSKEDEKRERERREERQREKMKRRQEMAQALQEGKFDAITNRNTNRNNKKFEKNDDRKRKYNKQDRKYDSFDKFRRQSDPPAAPSMF